MIFAAIKFALSWLAFILFADKKRYAQISPTCYFAVVLALITDLLMFVYPLWVYPSDSKFALFTRQLLNAFGIYFAVTFLFIQYLPKERGLFKLIRYVFYWTIFSILIEVIALWLGYIKHGHGWNLGWSYLSDWILLFWFYFHYKIRQRSLTK